MSESLVNKSSKEILECPPPLLTVNGKRRGRKPGVNSTLAQRSAANSRERSRMRVLSSAFIDLKSALPWVPKDTKMSKLDTLKLASGYIAYLKSMLVSNFSDNDNQLSPPWSMYDVHSSRASVSSNKCSLLLRTWSPDQSVSQLYHNYQSDIKNHYFSNNYNISNGTLIEDIVKGDSTSQTEWYNHSYIYCRNQNKNTHPL